MAFRERQDVIVHPIEGLRIGGISDVATSRFRDGPDVGGSLPVAAPMWDGASGRSVGWRPNKETFSCATTTRS